jgi:hypothetical protein
MQQQERSPQYWQIPSFAGSYFHDGVSF